MLRNNGVDRRNFLKTTGAVGAASVLPFSGTAAAAESGEKIDDSFDLSVDDLKEALVVFETNADVDQLRHLDLEDGYHKFQVLPIGYTKLTVDQIQTVADWSSVRYVEKNAELEYFNDDARSTTRAGAVQQELGYTGESVHAVVIDTGVDGSHPDLEDDLVRNWRYANPLSSSEDTIWTDAGDANTDDNGHGTHCSGSITGSGKKSDGEYTGLAPDADLTVYSAGLTLFVVKAVAAFDDMIARKRNGETDVQIVSNSWGSTGGSDFNPDSSVNVATWEAYQEGILPVFAAGNSGPGTNTLNPYATAPNVLAAAATHDDKQVTDFSSRGRTPAYDGETNYDRKTALKNLEKYHSKKTGSEVESGTYSGTVGPTASEFHQWDAPSKAGHIEASLSWTPAAEDVDFYLREGSTDGDVVASGATLENPETLSGAVEGGKTYFFEVRPFANVAADYDIEYTANEGVNGNVEPLGIYRNGVGATGNLVMSTLNPAHALQAYYEDTETWYGRISGTSMACPVTAGATTLVFDAYQQNGHGTPDPIDVLNTVEAEAEDVHDSYTPWNIGAGYVDAYDAAERAANGKLANFNDVDLVSE